MSGHLHLGAGPEFDRLRAIFARLAQVGHALGDDCALIRVQRATLALSIDLSLEGVHFRREWLSLQDIGYRAAAAALSDLAADAARPVGVLVSVAVPGDARAGGVDESAEIMTGVGVAAGGVGAKVFGGDLARAPKILVDVCAIGSAPRPVRRSGAQPGDGLWMTGELGGMALALQELLSGRRPLPPLEQRFARPVPRIAAAQWLASQGARAMIDLSDGLSSDAAHLAAASGVSLEIVLEQVPCWSGAEPLLAVASGEEYELLAAMPPSFGQRHARRFEASHAVRLTRIGTCSEGSGVRFTHQGIPVTPPAGYDHFAG